MEVLAGFEALFTTHLLLFLIAGAVAGILLGAMPGLDGTVGVALLLPITYSMEPLAALVFFSALYSAVMFGASTTAILFRIPGSTESIMTAIEGHPFTERGEAGKALSVAYMTSAIGGLIACIGLYLASPFLASVALRFGPAEYFALGVLGLSCISTIAGDNQLKGIAAALFGLLLGTVGLDSVTGAKRFDFGATVLLTGVPLVPASIGLFAASEVLRRIAARDTVLVRDAAHGTGHESARRGVRVRLPKLAELIALRWTVLRSSLIGLFIGILPGAGATTAGIVSYSAETKLSKNPEQFGKGKIEGVAAPEAANNAAAVGAMIPLLSLGIPGSATTAVMLGAFLIHNLQPGPMLFVQESALVYGLFAGISVANLVILIASLVLVRLFARLATVPYPVLATGIFTVCVVGSMAYGDTDAVMLMLAFACLGLLMESFGYPLAPLILGLVLAPIVEVSLRRALIMENFDIYDVVSRPVTAMILVCALMFLVAPWLMRLAHLLRNKSANGHSS